MELIYLWVEDYKNIKEQGFNFSGRYRCEYDKEKNELTINKSENHKHITFDNINIHAIVGENGSGKSSIFEHVNGHYANQRNKILLYSISDKIIIFALLEDKRVCGFIEVGKKYELEKIGYSGRVLETINDGMLFVTNNYGDNSYAKSITSTTINKNDNENIQLAVNLLRNSKIKLPFKTPRGLFMGLHGIERTLEDFTEDISYYLQKYRIESNFIETNLFYEDTKEYKIKLLNFYLLAVSINTSNRDLGNPYHWIVSECNAKNPNNIEVLIDIYEQYLKDSQNGKEKLSRVDVFIKQVKIFFTFENSFTLSAAIESIPNDFIENYTAIISSEQGGFRQNYQILEFSFSDGFSSGEEQFLFLFSQIYSYIQKKKILFIDEVELHFHPNWQRKYTYYLTEFLNMNFPNEQFNIYLATHSPFILSDIPKENIVFLENGKQINVNIDTFGANIHALLTHGFFMEDGLMGEYAKSKINKAIELLNKKGKLSKSSMKYCEEIISIIGEPVLQKTLQAMLNEKKSSHLTKLEKLKLQQKQIEEQIKALEEHQ